jgi:D-aspartate ligase
MSWKKNACALVLGGYVNGYSIIQELHDLGVKDIVLFDHKRRNASFSNKIRSFRLIKKDRTSLRDALCDLHRHYEYIVIFPTNDHQVEMLCHMYEEIESFCFVPVHKENSITYQDKFEQYQACGRLGIPSPKTVNINKAQDLLNIEELSFPIILKPVTRKDIISKVFRTAIVKDSAELERLLPSIEGFTAEGTSFLASEIIPGDGSNIYTYVGYRNRHGEILNEWTGKKLSQFPDDFGVFSSASNEAPEVVCEQGRALLNGMDLFGIIEPEFKYDCRDGLYKLMEINLRSTMWHRVGNLSGVHIQYTQWLDALGEKIERETQNKTDRIHFVYLKHEIINLIFRKGYLNIFRQNLFGGDKTVLAFFDAKDLKPFMSDITQILRRIAKECLRVLKGN